MAPASTGTNFTSMLREDHGIRSTTTRHSRLSLCVLRSNDVVCAENRRYAARAASRASWNTSTLRRQRSALLLDEAFDFTFIEQHRYPLRAVERDRKAPQAEDRYRALLTFA